MPYKPQKQTKASNKCSPARIAALEILNDVLTNGKTLLDTLPELEKECQDPRDLALAREIISGACRWLGLNRFYLKSLAPRLEEFPPVVQRILEMSVYQLTKLDRVPDYAVISDAVELTRICKMPGLTKAVNGILRNITRKYKDIALPDSTKDKGEYLSITHSLPLWLVNKWLDLWTYEEVESLCTFNNTRASLSLRVRGNIQDALDNLQKQEISAEIDQRFPDRLVINQEERIPQSVYNSPLWTVQDGAAMLIAPLLDPQPDSKIWDVCAAPGGKTFHLADLSGDQTKILASDRNASRLNKLKEQADKCSYDKITTMEIDALQEHPPLEGGAFDAILVDAPCSGWGTFRRHPDLRWRLQSGDTRRFGHQAIKLLEKSHKALKPGGILVYSTCTLSTEENQNVINTFLERHKDFTVEPVEPYLPPAFKDAQTKDGFLFVFPPLWNIDGAFAARLRKRI
jgi:16S rRNA (cytosine967-C5)-methyltransferase